MPYNSGEGGCTPFISVCRIDGWGEVMGIEEEERGEDLAKDESDPWYFFKTSSGGVEGQ
jgi:hypothetical protein